MDLSKANYEEASSKIVELLDDINDEGGDVNDYKVDLGNESKHAHGSLHNGSSSKISRKNNRNRKYNGKENPASNDNNEDTKPTAMQRIIYSPRRTSPMKPTPRNYVKNMTMNEVVDLLDSDDDIGDNNATSCNEDVADVKNSFDDDKKKNVPRNYVARERRPNNGEEMETHATTKKPCTAKRVMRNVKGENDVGEKQTRLSPSIGTESQSPGEEESGTHARTEPTGATKRMMRKSKGDNDAVQKRPRSSPTLYTQNQSRFENLTSNQPLDMTVPAEHPTRQTSVNDGGDKMKRPPSLSDDIRGNRNSEEGESIATAKRKRGTSKLSSTRKICLRPRPTGIPLERWLKSSVGRTREELNQIDDMVQYIGSCRFGQSVVVSKFGKVHAVVLNDEWNVLAQRNDEIQLWYVGLGPGRKRDARLVGASQTTIPIFHAPKLEYTTKELFYVGHYQVKNLEELNPPVVEMEKERDLLVTFMFKRFDERLDSIIKKGPTLNGSSPGCRRRASRQSIES